MAYDNSHRESFLEMMLVERGASLATIDAYRRDLESLSFFLNKREISLHLAHAQDLRLYIGHMVKQGLAPRTQARKLSCLRQYYQFLLVIG